MSVSQKLTHFWHVVSNVRPIFWLSLYVCLVPVFALVYWSLPPGQFRIPDQGSADFGGWLYYSIVTITTLGFGDYTPMHTASQFFTALEVMSGLVVIGFFLNAVGSMKSEMDVESEKERQRMLHISSQTEMMKRNIPVFVHKLNQFLDYCYTVTTPVAKRKAGGEYNGAFWEADMADMQKPSGLDFDYSDRPAVESLMRCCSSLCLYIDSLQTRVDLSIWPELLDDCFTFVADFQMLSPADQQKTPVRELMHFIRSNASIALRIESRLSEIRSSSSSQA